MYIINLSKDSSVSYPILDGYVKTENLSDALDSMTVIIPHVADSNFEPYDLIIVDTLGWLVANVTKEMISIEVDEEDNKTIYYNITLDLMSFTKILETIQLPNMTITNIGQNRGILYYVYNILTRYVTPALVKSYGATYFSNFFYDNNMIRFNGVVCPEFTFQSPTAREVLDALLSKLGCIIKLEFKREYFGDPPYILRINVLDLTSYSKPINETYLTSLTKVQSGDDYVTALSHSIENIIGQDSITEYQKPKTEDYLMTTENACILLNQKIYDIEKFEVSHPSSMSASCNVKKDGVSQSGILAGINFTNVDSITFSATYDSYGSVSSLYINLPSNTYFDVSSFLVVPEVYDSLETKTATYYEDGDSVYGWGDKNPNKNNALVFERGNKKIDNLFRYYTKQKIIGSESGLTAISAATAISIYNYFINNSTQFTFTDTHDGHNYTFQVVDVSAYEIKWNDSTIYRITYKPYMNTRFEMEDGETNNHHIAMQDNTTNASTDIGQFLAQSVEKNSKLGNPTIIATARVPSNLSNSVYKLGQYFQDGEDRYIVSTLEYQYKSNETLFKFTLTKNFTNRNLNTIINREKRYFALAKDEIVERSEIVGKTYINIFIDSDSANAKSLYSSSVAPTNGIKYNCLSWHTNVSSEGARIADGTIPLNTIYGGNSVIYSATFMDNINYKLFPDNTIQSGGYPMQQYRYTDEDGEFGMINCNIARVTNVNDLINQTYVSIPTHVSIIQKDQREKLTINFEYIYKASDSRIKIGSHFIDALLKNTDITITVKYFYTNGTSAIAFTNAGIPYSFTINDNDVQALMMLTPNNEDVMIIYNPPTNVYLNFNVTEETY